MKVSNKTSAFASFKKHMTYVRKLITLLVTTLDHMQLFFALINIPYPQRPKTDESTHG